MSRSRTILGVVGALAALTLTGCGALQPGVAVEVGDETITQTRVDEVAGDFCSAIEPQLESQAETIPNSFLRGGIAGTLGLRSAADQVADDYGVEAESEQYLEALASIRSGVANVPEEFRASVFEVESAPAYVEGVQAAVGEAILDGDGEYADFVAAGTDEFQAWIAENGIEFDPVLNTVIEDGVISTEDGGVSFAVSELAKSGLEEQPNSVVARQMPATHRCGR
jgi:hypothetical protein